MNLSKLPEPLNITGTLPEIDASSKNSYSDSQSNQIDPKTSDGAKIGVILSYAGKDARELYKTLSWKEEGDEKKFKICYMSDRDSDW